MIRKLQYFLIVHFFLIACSTSYKPTTVTNIIDNQVEVKAYPYSEISDSIKSILTDKETKQILPFELLSKSSKDLYLLNKHLAIWKSDSLIKEGIQLINNSKYHGLNPGDYNIHIIDSLNKSQITDSLNRIKTLAFLDIAITDGVLKYCRYLLKGKLIPAAYHPSWNYNKREINQSDSLLLYLISQNKVNQIENNYQPKTDAYNALKKELVKFNQFEKDTITFGEIEYPGFVLRKGDSNQFVLQLKNELKLRAYLKGDSLNLSFDLELEEAVKEFQTKHGLTADGIPGKKTYEFLRWSIDKYKSTLAANMERMRWMSDSLPEVFIKVNIPAYQLKLYSNKQLIFNSKIIVGKYKNQTPVFWSGIDYLVFNPCWTIPNSIASKKILPRLKTDTSYIDKRNMFITLNGVTQDHSNIDFSKYSEENFPYKIFQRTGAGNALGRVKFMFKNGYSIYLHDTPGKSLFARDHRAFSHGCVRVQNAVNLSEIILHKLENSNVPLSYYFDKGYPEKVYLKKPIPLYLQYLTCDFNVETGMVQFFKDIYAMDYKVINDLKADK